MNRKVIFLLAVVLVLCVNAHAQWKLVWSDEFDKSGSVDTSNWIFETGPNWYNGELQYYTNRNENARIENGNLVIEAKNEDYLGKKYTSARMHSFLGWKYGRFEIRAKLADGSALWPAIWMYPEKEIYGDWPKSGEIDIMENWSWNHNEIFGTVHCESYYHVKHTEKQGNITVENPSENYHVYAIEWYEDQIIWFVDDVPFFRVYSEGTTSTYPFNHPFHLILNLAIESTAPGKESTWTKRTMEVDYVRVYSGEMKGPAIPVITVPAKVEAENFVNIQGIKSENCSEGTRDLCNIESGDWVEYKINVPATDIFMGVLRIASSDETSLDVIDGIGNIVHVIIPNTNGWQSWKNVEIPMNLMAGVQKIRILANGSFNINWFEIKRLQ
jgi:beta-glucanase (GH16 family)